MRMSALVVAALLPMAAAAQEKPSKDALEASAKKIGELRKERIVILRGAAEVSMKLAQSNRLEIWEAMEDQMALLRAELDAAATEAERLALYKGTVNFLKAFEEMAKVKYESARGTDLSLRRIRARRLELEIQLEQARLKEAQASK